MAPEELDLGALDLASRTSGLQLRLTSRAKLFTIVRDPSCSLVLPISTSSSHNPVAYRITIAQRMSFRLSLALNGILDGGRRSKLFEGLARILYTAEMWSQLQLQPVSIRLNVKESDPKGIIEICLRQADSKTSSLKNKRQHKLADGHNVEPPASLHQVQLKEIYLGMSMHSTRHGKRRRSHSRDRDVLQHNYESDLRDDLSDQDVDLLGDSAAGTSPHSGYQEIGQSNDTLLTTLRCERESSVLTLEPVFPKCWQHLRPAQRRPFKEETRDTLCGNVEQAIMELFDAGVRLAVIPRPKPEVNGVRITRNESFKPLADFAPSIWLPGYVDEISNRAVFLSLIGQTLSEVGGNHARSPCLKRKILELERRATSHNFHLSITPDLDSSASAITTQLWKMMRASVHKKHSAPEICPLEFVGKDHLSGDSEMLRECVSFMLDDDLHISQHCRCNRVVMTDDGREGVWGYRKVNAPTMCNVDSTEDIQAGLSRRDATNGPHSHHARVQYDVNSSRFQSSALSDDILDI